MPASFLLIFIILLILGPALALPGNFLLLRKESMLADSLAHSSVLGIVAGFLLAQDIMSPLITICAVIFGIISLLMTEWIVSKSRLESAEAISIIYPFFFSAAVLISSLFLRDTSLNTDTILMGEALMMPLIKIKILSFEIPAALFSSSLLLFLNISVVFVFYRVLKISSFDPEFSLVNGISTEKIRYLLLGITVFSSVTAFSAVGAILVISLMISAPASALLLSRRLKNMILLSMAYSIFNVSLGFILAISLNLSISGCIAFSAFLSYFFTSLFSPDGSISALIRKFRQRKALKADLIILHIGNNQDREGAEGELGEKTLLEHFNLRDINGKKLFNSLVKREMIVFDAEKRYYTLGTEGKIRYDEVLGLFGK